MMTFNTTYTNLKNNFFYFVHPTSAVSPELILYNELLDEQLGLQLAKNSPKELSHFFSGLKLPNDVRPFAMAYAGHQFGNFAPTLGDGRAIMLGEFTTPSDRFDLQLKGAGQTPFSFRNGMSGDGRSALGPVIREYLVSEAMNSLGVPTTRSLAAVTTGEMVVRNGEFPGAILARVSKGHIRIGTFEFFAFRKAIEELVLLTKYCINRFYPEIDSEDDNYARNFFLAVSKMKLKLVAKWMGLGFIHGVMNTDNTSVCGETIDYGPCAFMDHFEHHKVFSSIDHNGRYAYSHQGKIALWNLSSLANCLAPLIPNAAHILVSDLEDLKSYFEHEWLIIMTQKMGIKSPKPKDVFLVKEFLDFLEKNNLDFTNSFRQLPNHLQDSKIGIYAKLGLRLKEEGQDISAVKKQMNNINPYIIPRNHQIEKAIQKAHAGDYSYFKFLNQQLSGPFTETLDKKDLTSPPKPEEVVHQTFCGT